MKSKKTAIIVLIIIMTAAAAAVSGDKGMANSYVGLNISDTYFAFNMGTSSSNSPANANLLFDYANSIISSHMVVKVSNTAYDLENTTYCPVSGTVLSDGSVYIRGVKKVANLVNVTVLWQFVDNPATGTRADTAKIEVTITNRTNNPVNVALRLELDTQVVDNDGTNISIDNGFSVIDKNTAWYKSAGQIPENWWDFDVNPNVGTPTLVGRGYNYGNLYGTAATAPDIMEIANWVDVSGTAQWSIAPADKDMSTLGDSAVVLWWCNGDETSSGYTLPSNNTSVKFITYYGINQEKMLTTPTVTGTITASYTQTPVFTATDSRTPTNTPVITMTSTGSISPTITVTQTCTNTLTATNTLTGTNTYTPTFVVTETLTNTPSVTGTYSPTASCSRTFTPSLTITATSTASVTFTPTGSITASITTGMTSTIPPLTVTFTQTVTLTFTEAPTHTVTVTLTATPVIASYCFELLGAFPNPFDSWTKIFYKVCKAAEVDAVIYTASGEVVRRIHQQAQPGWNRVYWDGTNNAGRNTASGVFIYSIEADCGDEKQKLWGKVAEVK